MTPQAFIEKWRDVELKERSASQSHFNDLCRLLDVLDPTSADPKGTWFTFEKGASKTSGGEGWADVWRENCFGWEYKGKRKDLNAALAQLRQYALALDNPPLLIVSDMDQIHIHTNWTNTVHKTYQLTLEDLRDAFIPPPISLPLNYAHRSSKSAHNLRSLDCPNMSSRVLFPLRIALEMVRVSRLRLGRIAHRVFGSVRAFASPSYSPVCDRALVCGHLCPVYRTAKLL
jgi:hypothetical protein